MSRLVIPALAAALLLCSAGELSARKWRDGAGKHSIEAEFIQLLDGTVTLKRDDAQMVKLPLTRLCGTDRRYIARINRSAAKNLDTDKPLRTWTSSDGHQAQAQLIDAEDGRVRLKKKSGLVLTLAIEWLSEEDRKYVESELEKDRRKTAAAADKTAAAGGDDPPPENVPPTHEHVGTVRVAAAGQPIKVNTFCVDGDGNLLVACGGSRTQYVRGPGGLQANTVAESAQIRVFDPDGQPLAAWAVDVTPQVVNVAPDDGTVYIAGQGRMAKLNKKGKVLQVADSPQVAELTPLEPSPGAAGGPGANNSDQKARVAKAQELAARAAAASAALHQAFRELQAAMGNPGANERYNKALAEYQAVEKELKASAMSPEMIAAQKMATAMRKRAVTGIAVTEQDVFVACPSTQGSGYDVWRTDRDLGNAKKIVTALRGCCGQMDIQARDGELYVAENARGRVVRYDREGKQLGAWGKRDRKDIRGFGSCCNPMNIRFGPEGQVHTSEATMGRIKRYSLDGKFLGLVGQAKIVPGCKHAAIGIGPKGDRVYLLDITRSQIHVLVKQGSGGKSRI